MVRVLLLAKLVLGKTKWGLFEGMTIPSMYQRIAVPPLVEQNTESWLPSTGSWFEGVTTNPSAAAVDTVVTIIL